MMWGEGRATWRDKPFSVIMKGVFRMVLVSVYKVSFRMVSVHGCSFGDVWAP